MPPPHVIGVRLELLISVVAGAVPEPDSGETVKKNVTNDAGMRWRLSVKLPCEQPPTLT